MRSWVLRTAAGLVLSGALLQGACATFQPPPHPLEAAPRKGAPGYDEWQEAMAAKGRRIVVSLGERRLWLLEGMDTIMSSPVAVGRDVVFKYGDKTYRFHTPRGRRIVRAKERNPVWVPPDWHYLERAAYRKLEPVRLERGKKYDLGDGTYLEIRGDQVGRVNQFGNFAPWTPGKEIIFYGKIYIPPFDTAQRRIPDALGPYKLDLGDGYLIHGTNPYTTASIGRAASHGCIRMRNEDLGKLYQLVEVGTPVHIY